MAKIIRRKDFAGGGVTAAELAAMAEHVRLWTSRAFRTEPADPAEVKAAIDGLYLAAGLKPVRVVLVPSPLVMAVAGGFASAIWYARKNGRPNAATRAATRAATDAATYAATDADYSWVRELAVNIDPSVADFMLACVPLWSNCYQGGNMWAAYECYLGAARDVLGLRLPEHERYAAWERAALCGGFRYMHDEFCLVTDFPELIRADAQARPHCDDGPSHRWRDGWSLYHVRGVRVSARVVEAPHTLTFGEIQSERNAEVRRVMIEKWGWPLYLTAAGASVLDTRRNDVEGTVESLLATAEGRVLACACPSTGKVFALEVPGEVEDCAAAQRYLSSGLSPRIVAAS